MVFDRFTYHRPEKGLLLSTFKRAKNILRYQFVKISHPKKMCIGGSEQSPHIIWKVCCVHPRIELIKTEKPSEILFHLYSDDEILQEILFKNIIFAKDGYSFGPVPGWYLWTCNNSINVYND
jgi:hypothetical protein